MESLLHEYSISPRKQMKNSKKKSHHLYNNHHHQHSTARLPSILRQSSCNIVNQNYAPSPKHVQLEMVHAVNNTGGVFFNHFPTNINNNPFSHSNSLPPILPSFQPHYQHLKMIYHQQPPLLPLPAVSKPTFHSLPALTRRSSLSTPVPGKQTDKKSTNQNKKKQLNNNNNNMSNKELVAGNSKSTTKTMSKTSLLVENEVVGPTKAVGTNPDSDPKEPTRVFADLNKNGVVGEVEIFCLSPSPSSLPLPKFGSLRKQQQQQQQTKLSCKVEAAVEEVETGVATDNLCRLLKLR